MRTSRFLILVSGLLVLASLLGCQSVAPIVDTQATISAAVAATSIAQANLQATVDAAVKATAAAQPTLAATPTQLKATLPAATAVVPATTAVATPKPAATAAPAVNYTTMTEEELAALIDQAVQEAVTATTSASTTTTTYSADGTLTPQEVQAMMLAATMAQTEITQAESAVQAYYDLYGQLATDTLTTLKAIEQDLNSMATSMNSMSQSLAGINTTLSQGQATTQAAITQLQTNATKAAQAAASAQTKDKNWNTTVQGELNKRAAAALNTAPTNVPTDWRGTLQGVNSYLDTVKGALGDTKISKTELLSISTAGANATAGLKQFGGADGQKLTDSINGMTKQLARGEAPKAKNNLGSLELSAKSLPSVPNIPRK